MSRAKPKHSPRAKARTSPAHEHGGILMVGWRESVAFPEWGIRSVKAKVDTGARTSALHVEDLLDLGDGRVRFRVVRHLGDEEPLEITARIYRFSRVKPSSGAVEDRYVIRTTIRIGPIERPVEVSLVSREKMLCRMLVGRNALPEGAVVDPHRRYLHGRPRRKVKRKRVKPKKVEPKKVKSRKVKRRKVPRKRPAAQPKPKSSSEKTKPRKKAKVRRRAVSAQPPPEQRGGD